MKIGKVKKLKPEERFAYWIKERHKVYKRKEAGKPKPWTDDEILQSYFFTCPYRENDKTTAWFRETVRESLKTSHRVLMATIIFRWFNRIETGKFLIEYGLLTHWNNRKALKLLKRYREQGNKPFTGAFMINSPPGVPKLNAICERINNVWKDREKIVLACDPSSQDGPKMEHVHNVLTQYPGLGGFMAYEVVCDLRYTYFLHNALDKMTWCNPGPGCIRGLHRLAGNEWKGKGNNATSPKKPDRWLDTMETLLLNLNQDLEGMPKFEMREVEHSLCEWDKYERALWGDGKLKRRYKGV